MASHLACQEAHTHKTGHSGCTSAAKPQCATVPLSPTGPTAGAQAQRPRTPASKPQCPAAPTANSVTVSSGPSATATVGPVSTSWSTGAVPAVALEQWSSGPWSTRSTAAAMLILPVLCNLRECPPKSQPCGWLLSRGRALRPAPLRSRSPTPSTSPTFPRLRARRWCVVLRAFEPFPRPLRTHLPCPLPPAGRV